MKTTLIPFNDHKITLGVVSFDEPQKKTDHSNKGVGGAQKPKIIWRQQNDPIFEYNLRVGRVPSLIRMYQQTERFI